MRTYPDSKFIEFEEHGHPTFDPKKFIEFRFNSSEGSVNIFNDQVMTDLEAALDVVAADHEDIQGLMLTSGKSTFIVGADLNEVFSIYRNY